MLPPFKNADGTMRVVNYTPLTSTPRYAGIAVTNDGNICYSASNPTQFVNGYGVTATGQLSLQAGPIVGYAGGMPRNANGAVVAAFNQVVPASVGWVGGMAVGAAGLYVATGSTTGTLDPFPDDMDNDGLPDTGVLIVGTTVITQDADSVNIDIDGDGNVDVVIPK